MNKSKVLNKYDFHVEATGSQWHVSLWIDGTRDHEMGLLWDSCVALLEQFETTYSRFRETSRVVELSGVRGDFTVGTDFVTMLRLYRILYDATDGAFTPLGGQVLADMGYDRDYSFQVAHDIAQIPAYDAAIRIVDDTHISIVEEVFFDFGALGKGYLADKLAAHIAQHPGIKKYVVNAGGDIIHWDAQGEKLRVGLENPDNVAEVVGVYELGNGVIASSATNRRQWTVDETTYHHIFDPSTRRSVSDIRASWVVHENLAMADGLATALFVSSPQHLRKCAQFEYAYITHNNDFITSPAMRRSFY